MQPRVPLHIEEWTQSVPHHELHRLLIKKRSTGIGSVSEVSECLNWYTEKKVGMCFISNWSPTSCKWNFNVWEINDSLFWSNTEPISNTTIDACAAFVSINLYFHTFSHINNIINSCWFICWCVGNKLLICEPRLQCNYKVTLSDCT